MYHIDVLVRHTFIHKKKNQIEMKYLLSLPSNAADSFHTINNKSRENWFCTSDPKDKRLGSGGGTVWLVEQCYQADNSNGGVEEWLQNEKRVLIHAGGQSRRLPSYAIMGKTCWFFTHNLGHKCFVCHSLAFCPIQIPLSAKRVNIYENHFFFCR